MTEIDLEDPKPFPNNETMALGKQIESLNSSYDSTFWEDYTIILPEQDFGTIARSIDQKNQSHNHKEEIEHRINRYAKQKDIRVDSILSFYNRKGLFNGNALVTYEGELIFEKSYNNDLTKNHENSQFRIGSTSKTFTAMLVMLLEAQSKLQLSDPVSKFLPDYKHGKATIKQLLTHQSGIPDYLNDGFHLDELYAKAYTTDELISRFCSDTLEFAHGQQFDYSNSGYVLLAGIIEKVTDKPFGQVLQEMIFEPLGMTDSYFGTSANNKNLSKGYLFNQPEPNFPVLNTIGAGGITTTTQDLLKWSRALDNASLVSNDLIKELWEPRAAYLDWDAYYGYGWMIDQAQFGVTKKHQIVYHPGTDNGFNSMFLKQPDKGITIILLNNTGAFPRFDITDLILAELDR
ncbi:MAG: serine hydrolase domain-containing protein [Bacteroidota bacterium]